MGIGVSQSGRGARVDDGVAAQEGGVLPGVFWSAAESEKL